MTGTDELALRAAPYDHPDAVALTELAQKYYQQIYGGRDSEVLTPAQLAPPGGGFLIGYRAGSAVAMGGWLFSMELPCPGDAQVRRMFTHPQWRGHGYGRQLLTALEADAADRGATRMVLATGYRQAAAVAMYRGCGYAEIEPFGYYAGHDGVACLGRTLRQPSEPFTA